MKRALLAFAFTLVASQALAQSRPYYDSTTTIVRAHCQALDDRLPGLECLDPTVSARSSTSGNRSTTYEKTFPARAVLQVGRRERRETALVAQREAA